MKQLLLLLSISLATAAYALQPGVKQFQQPEKAPDLVLTDSNNNTHRISDYQGKVLIVNFWATWCVPCRKEIPLLKHAWKTLEKEGIQLLSVATNDSVDDVVNFQKENNIEYPLPLDHDGEVANSWAVTVVPTAFVIDPAGEIAMRIVGGSEWSNPNLIESIIALKQHGSLSDKN